MIEFDHSLMVEDFNFSKCNTSTHIILGLYNFNLAFVRIESTSFHQTLAKQNWMENKTSTLNFWFAEFKCGISIDPNSLSRGLRYELWQNLIKIIQFVPVRGTGSWKRPIKSSWKSWKWQKHYNQTLLKWNFVTQMSR